MSLLHLSDYKEAEFLKMYKISGTVTITEQIFNFQFNWKQWIDKLFKNKVSYCHVMYLWGIAVLDLDSHPGHNKEVCKKVKNQHI